MTPAKIMVVYGTRPEAIKLAPVIKELRARDEFETLVVSTGQHREMLAQVTELFGFEPDIDLGLMHRKQPLNRIMSRALKRLDKVLKEFKPDALIVQGDTSTAASAAIAGFNREAKIIHLEAGLRSFDLSSPFPEEANRKIISAIASLHLTPTNRAKNNLIAEGISEDAIVVTGNTVIDALLEAAAKENHFSNASVENALREFDRRVIFTSHRRENLDSLAKIGVALGTLAERYSDTAFFVPMHLNPRIREHLLPSVEHLPNVVATGPLPYDEFIHLMKQSGLIITDSGGVQEEAPALGLPALLIRDTTERPEAIEAGVVKMIGPDPNTIISEATELLDNPDSHAAMRNAVNPYGDGHAAERTVKALGDLFNLTIDTQAPALHPRF